MGTLKTSSLSTTVVEKNKSLAAMSEHTMFRDPQKATAPEQTLFDLFYSRLGEKAPVFSTFLLFDLTRHSLRKKRSLLVSV